MTPTPPAVSRGRKCARTAALLTGLAVAPASADWPNWRGPAFDGRAEPGLLTDGEFTLELAWKRPLGIGYSGVSVAAGLAVTMYSDGTRDSLVALDAETGETAWSYDIAAFFPDDGGGSDGGAKTAPAIDGDVVYALGPAGDLVAIGLADGAERWRTGLNELLGVIPPSFGFATSPVVVGDLIVIQTGAFGGKGVTAVNKHTGKTVWALSDDSGAYQTAIPAELAAAPVILAPLEHEVLGIDPATGTALWAHTHHVRNIPTPVLLGDDRFLLPGDSKSMAVRVVREEEAFEVERLWRSRALKRSWATPVLHDGHLYGRSGERLTCVTVEDGKRVWSSREARGHALILVDGHLVMLAHDGDVVVAKASPDGYQEVARVAALDRGGYAYPSYSDGLIFVRNSKDIAAVAIRR